MKLNKNIIIIIVIGLILISFGIILLVTNRSTKEPLTPNPSVNQTPSPSLPIEPDDIEPVPPIQEKEFISKEKALDIIKSIHEIEGQTITFKEEVDDFYIFEQKNSESVVFNTFKFNKETGEIKKDENYNSVPNNI